MGDLTDPNPDASVIRLPRPVHRFRGGPQEPATPAKVQVGVYWHPLRHSEVGGVTVGHPPQTNGWFELVGPPSGSARKSGQRRPAKQKRVANTNPGSDATVTRFAGSLPVAT